MYMAERFGAWQIGDDPARGAAEFKIFIPGRAKDPTQYQPSRIVDGHPVPDFGDAKIASIRVAGSFQSRLGQLDWSFGSAPAMTREDHPKGSVWRYRTGVELPAGFYEYKFLVTFEDGTKRKVGDPCTRYGGTENQNSALVVGGSDPAIASLAGGRKHLRDLVVYELMIDDFTDEFRRGRAPLDAVRDKLDYLAGGLGVNAILFMPWTAWPGEGYNWGYNPYQYFSVEYRYANAIDQPAEKLSWLKRLVTACHERGLHVIMDGVFNHVGDVDPSGDLAYGFPYRWFYQDPLACPYVGTFGGEFAGLKDLDFNNGCTREFIRDVCLYWIDEFKIDGIRFDNSVNYYIDGDPRGLPQLLADIDDHLESRGEKNFSLTIEHLNLDAARVTRQTRATSYWNNELYQRCFDYLWAGSIDSRIMGALDTHRGLPDDRVATTYLGNHDHSHVAWQAGARDNAGALQWYRTQPFLIALLTGPGAVMIQNGQEFAEDHWIMEDDGGSNRRVKPRPLRWDFPGDPIGSRLVALYGKLVRLRRAHPALSSNNFYPAGWQTWQSRFNPEGYGVDVDTGVVIFHRWGTPADGGLERFIVALNFSREDRFVGVPFSVNGEWHDLLNDHTDVISDFRLVHYRLESNWGRVWFHKSPG
jgi:pullulanase/glycogen debranching enzyme